MRKLLVIAGIAALAVPAFATTVTLTEAGFYGSNTAHVNAGVEQVYAESQFLKEPGGNPFEAFCTDIKHYVYGAPATWTAQVVQSTPGVGFTSSDITAIGTTWSHPALSFGVTELNEATWLADQYGVANHYNGATNTVESAEYQVAIWKVLYGGTNAVADDSTIETKAGGLAADAVAAIKGGANVAGVYYAAVPDGSNRSQDFLTWTGGNRPTPPGTPEPFSMVLGAACLGLAVIRRRTTR